MSCLLFVDDDKNILEINRHFFSVKGNDVHVALDMHAALECLDKCRVDCVILDILMPNNDGLEVCEKIRASYCVPIMFLTGLTEKEFIYRGFAAGCDDYLTKPYDMLELEMRIIAIVKRHKGGTVQGKALCFAPLTIDVCRRRVDIDGREIVLTAYEFEILQLLAQHAGQMYTMSEIYREVWHMPDIDNAQTVQVHLGHMRHKLEQACPDWTFVKTIWKQGYRFDPTKKAKAD